jgi:hypothetical protein
MSKVKLDLRSKDFLQLRTFATGHRDAMAGNANFTTPVPTVAEFGASLDGYDAKLDEISAAEVDLLTLRAERDALRVTLEEKLSDRGIYVETTSGGDMAKILSAAFEVQADATPTTSMEKPYDLSATMGDNAGEIDLGCHAVPKSKSYIFEMREHSDSAAPGAWVQAKISTRSSTTIEGLASGKKYAFRVRALGPNDLESPWSDEVTCMAP